jgi:N-acetylglucosamine kinase-like BadF-type ATPase
MKYIVGIDGGGTKTSCLFADESGKSLLQTTGRASNFLSIGTENAAANIISLIKSGLAKLNSSFDDIQIIVAGISGAGRKFHADNLREFILKKVPEGFSNIFIESDARIALEGALAGEAGAVLIAGTGSVIYGKDKSGKFYRAGGFGKLVGDEGSGYAIGIRTLNIISRMIDGREAEGEILKKFSTIFHINNEDDLISLVHNSGFDVSSIAMFTIKSAAEGNAETINILETESSELINHILVIKNKLKLLPLKLVLIGSLIENDNFYSQELIKKIKRIKEIQLHEKKFSPEMGAVIMAKQILSNNKFSN